MIGQVIVIFIMLNVFAMTFVVIGLDRDPADAIFWPIIIFKAFYRKFKDIWNE